VIQVSATSRTKCFKHSAIHAEASILASPTSPKSCFWNTIPSDLSIFRNCRLKLNQQLQPSIEFNLLEHPVWFNPPWFSFCNETEITLQVVYSNSTVTWQNLWLKLALKSTYTNRDCSWFKCLATLAVYISRMKRFRLAWHSVYLLRVASVTFRRFWFLTDNSLPKKL